MNNKTLFNTLKKQQQEIQKSESHQHVIKPSIEELEKYAHTKVGASYLKARLLFDEGKKEFFSGHQHKGIELIKKGFWQDEKACDFSDAEGDAIVEYCSKKVVDSSQDIDLQYACGMILAFISGMKEAQVLMFPYLIQEGSFRAVTLMGSWLATAGEWEDALNCFMRGYQIDPTDVENYYAIGVVYKFLEDFQAAREWLERYIECSDIQDYKRPAAHYELASLLIVERKMSEALEQAKLGRITLAQRIPYLPPLSTSSKWMVEHMLELMGETNSIPKSARKAAEKVGKSHAVMNASTSASASTGKDVQQPSKQALECKEKGNELFEKKNYNQAIEYYLKALSGGQSSLDSALHSNISLCFAKLDKFIDSLTHSEKSILSDPYNSKAYARKAFALMKLDRMQDATKCAIISSALGMKILKGHELFSLLPDSSSIILVRNSFDLKRSILEKNTSEKCYLVITDEDSYNISTEITRPCSLIGIGREKPKFTGMFQSLFMISSPDCYFDNLSISQSDIQLVYVSGKGNLTAKNCHFFSSSNPMPLVACGEGAKLTLIHCEIYGAANSGGVMAHDNGSIVKLTNCKIHDCSKAALEVISQAKAEVDNCEFFNCGQGIIGYNNGKSIKVHNSKVYQNAKEGILISMGCSAIFTKLSIFKNNHFGLSVDNTGIARLTECEITDNIFYGVSVKGDCPFEMHNCTVSGQCGGIRIGINYTSPIKLTNCKILNNQGPGIHNETDRFKSPQEKKNFLNQMKQIGLNDNHTAHNKIFNRLSTALGGALQLTITDCLDEGNESNNVDPSKFATNEHKCSFCNHTAEKYYKCSKCKEVLYCGVECQRKDWPKHKIFCDSLAENNTVIIDASKCETVGKLVRNTKLSSGYQKRQDERKGKYLNGEEFIVKIQTLEMDNSPDQVLTLYDESRELSLNFSHRDLYYLIMKCGILGDNKMTSKKIFLKATFDKEKDLLLIKTHKVLHGRLW